MKTKVEKISDSVFIVRGAAADIGVNFERTFDVSYSGLQSSNLEDSHVPIGRGDKLLHTLHKISSESPNKWPLMKTKRDFLVAKGVEVKTVKRENGQKTSILGDDPETLDIEDFLEEIDYTGNLFKKAIDYVFSGRYYILMKLDLDGKVQVFDRVDVFHCRPIQLQQGEWRISRYGLNPNYGTGRYRANETVILPAFDRTNPLAYPVCIIDIMEVYPGQFYHPFGEWWGTVDWTEVTNKIPKFHKSGLDNGYNIKYHISVPDDYFKKDVYPDGMDEEKLKALVLDEIGDSLSGVDNVDKVLYTFHKVFTEGRYAESGIKITPLPNPMSDEAYTKILDTSNKMQVSGHRVLPVLAGIDTGGKLGGSGKELEAAANFQQGFLTYTDRYNLTSDFKILKKIMGWSRDKKLEFEDIRLYTYDVTPAAAAENPNNKQDKQEDPEEDPEDDTKEDVKPKQDKDADKK